MAQKSAKKTTKAAPAKKAAVEATENASSMLQDSVSASFGIISEVRGNIEERVEEIRETSPKELVAKLQDRVEEAREDSSKQWKKMVSKGQKSRTEAREALQDSVEDAIEKASFDVNFSFSLKEKMDEVNEVAGKLRDMFSPKKTA